MKRTLQLACNTTPDNIPPIRTRYKDRKKEQAKQAIKNNNRPSSRSLSQQSLTSEDQGDQYIAYAYKCGCEYSTDSIHSFKNHVLDAHRGEFLKGSTHFLSGMTKVVLPCIQNKPKSSENKLKLNSNDFDWKTKLKEAPGEIWWNGFVLIRNRNFKREAFYCGQCIMPFVRTIDYVNHCLTECGQLQNQASSHFIYDETDWKLKVKEQQLLLKTKPKPIVEEHKTNKQTNHTQKPKSLRIQKDSKDQDFHKQIVNFTVNYPFQSHRKLFLSLGKYYFHVNNKIVFYNFNLSEPRLLKKFKCFTCDLLFSNKYEFYKHLYDSGQRQDQRSGILVFDRELFYQANQERLIKYMRLQQIRLDNFKIDFEFVQYLSKKNVLSAEWFTYLQSMLSYSGIIKSFSYVWQNFQFDDEIFKCEACDYTIQCRFYSCHVRKINDHICSGNIECRNKNYAFIQLQGRKPIQSRQRFMLNARSRYLQNEKFFCPCQRSIVLSKVQFVNHIVNQHNGLIHFQLPSTPTMFE